MLLSVLDYLDSAGKPDLQAALDAASDGDRIYMPGLMAYQAPPGGYRIRKRVELFGDGPGKKDSYTGTVLVAGAQNDPVLVLDASVAVELSNVYLHDFQINRPQGQPGRWGGDGIVFAQAPAQKLSGVVVERVEVFHLNGSGFSFLGFDLGDGAVVGLHMLDCAAEDCGLYGLTLEHATVVNVMHCLLKGNGHCGCKAVLSGVALYQCVLDGNDGDGDEGSLHFLDCFTSRVDACRVLGFAIGDAKTGIVCVSTEGAQPNSGAAMVVGGCYFEGTLNEACVGISVPSIAQSGPVLVLPNRFSNVATLVSIGQEVTGCVVFPQSDESGAGAMVVPNAPNVGLVAVPSLNQPSANAITGLVVPAARVGNPSVNLEDGTLAWNHDTGQLMVQIAGVWKTVQRAS